MLKIFKYLISAILIISILVLGLYIYARYIEPKKLIETNLDFKTTLTLGNTEEINIALFADTHFSEYYDLNDFSKVVDSINSKKPDIVLFAGDLIDEFDTYTGSVSAISEALKQIEATYGKYAVFGNHDYGGGSERRYEDIMEAGGFTVLKNDYIALDNFNLGIVGIDDYQIGYGNADIGSYARPDYYNIALSHAPDIMDMVLAYNIDVMFAGHTHGRQINFPIFDEIILPPYGKKYPKGLYTFENERESLLYVNSGLGTTKYPLRFMSPPEVTFITVKGSSAE